MKKIFQLVVLLLLLCPCVNMAYSQTASTDPLVRLNLAVKHDPASATAWYNRGAYYYKTGKYDLAVADLTQSVTLNPDNIKAIQARGNCYLKLSKLDSAILDYSTVLEDSSDDKEVLIQRADTYQLLGKYRASISDYSDVLDLDSTKDAIWSSRATSYYRLGKYDSAITDFAKAIGIKPNNPTYIIRIILTLCAEGQYAKAGDYYALYRQKKLNGYIELPDNLFLKTYINACTSYLSNNDYTNALQTLQQAVQVYKPSTDKATSIEYANIVAKIGGIYEQTDSLNGALEYYTNAKMINPDAQEVIAKITHVREVMKNNATPAMIMLDSPAHTTRGQYIEAEVTNLGTIYVKGFAQSPVGIKQLKINGAVINTIDSVGNFQTYISDSVTNLFIEAVTKKNVVSDTAFQIEVKRKKGSPKNLVIPAIGDNENFYAIFIANSNYTGNKWQPIDSAISEAESFKQLLIDDYNFLPENIDTIYNKSKQDIVKRLNTRLQSLTENDNAIIFYGGHGYFDAQSNRAYLVPINANDKTEYISSTELKDYLSGLQAKHILMLADACYSGGLRSEADAYVPSSFDFKLRSRQLLSSGSIETVPGKSVFIPNIIEVLKNNDNEFFSAADLWNKIYSTVKDESGRTPQLAPFEGITNSGAGQFFFRRKTIDSAHVKDPAELEKLRQKEIQQKLEFANKKRAFDSLILSGKSFRERDMLSEALREFKSAIAINPEPLNTYAKNLYDEVYKIYGLTPKERFALYVDSAKVYEHKRAYTSARNFYLKAIDIMPDEKQNLTATINAISEKSAFLTRMDGFFKNLQYKDAVKEYSRIIKLTKTDPDYYLGRARCYDKLSNYDDALADFNTAVKLDPTYLEAIKGRAELQRNNNKKMDAISDYQNCIGLEKDPLVYMELFKLHKSLNFYNDAVGDLTNAVTLNPQYTQAYYNRGEMYFDSARYQDAFDDFNITVQQDSSSAVNYFQRGSCFVMLNKLQEASADYKTARRKRLDSIYIKSIEAYADNIYDTAVRCAKQKLYDSALFYINRSILVNPLSSIYRNEKGNYYYELGTFAQAIKNYDSAVDLKPDYNEALYKRGMAYYNLSKYEASIDNFEKALQLDAVDINAMKAKADAWFQLANYKNAIPVYEQSLQVIDNKKGAGVSDSVKSRINNNLGFSYYKNGLFDQSIRSLKKAVKLDENYALGYYNLGMSYQQNNNDLKDAAENVDKALSLYDNYVWNYSDGEIYRQKNNYDRAVTLYSKAIDNDTSKILLPAFYYRGYCYSQMGNSDSAIKDYQAAIRYNVDTSFPDFNNQLGALYLHSGSYDSAYVYYSKSFARYGTDANAIALYGMASALYLQKKIDDAYPLFEHAFKTLVISKSAIKDDKNYATFKADKKFKDLFNKYY